MQVATARVELVVAEAKGTLRARQVAPRTRRECWVRSVATRRAAARAAAVAVVSTAVDQHQRVQTEATDHRATMAQERARAVRPALLAVTAGPQLPASLRAERAVAVAVVALELRPGPVATVAHPAAVPAAVPVRTMARTLVQVGSAATVKSL